MFSGPGLRLVRSWFVQSPSPWGFSPFHDASCGRSAVTFPPPSHRQRPDHYQKSTPRPNIFSSYLCFLVRLPSHVFFFPPLSLFFAGVFFFFYFFFGVISYLLLLAPGFVVLFPPPLPFSTSSDSHLLVVFATGFLSARLRLMKFSFFETEVHPEPSPRIPTYANRCIVGSNSHRGSYSIYFPSFFPLLPPWMGGVPLFFVQPLRFFWTRDSLDSLA